VVFERRLRTFSKSRTSRNDNHFSLSGQVFWQFDFEQSILLLMALHPVTLVTKIFHVKNELSADKFLFSTSFWYINSQELISVRNIEVATGKLHAALVFPTTQVFKLCILNRLQWAVAGIPLCSI